MQVLTMRLLLAVVGLLALAVWMTAPRAIESVRLLRAQDDPAHLADLQVKAAFGSATAAREVEAALAADDPELAQSFVDLADAHSVDLDPALRARVAEAIAAGKTTTAVAGRFARGFVSGEPQDATELVGTIAGDLFVYGDLRDIVREGGRALRGEPADELILGLACIGLAVTGGTYATIGGASPARLGLSVAKAAGRAGGMTARLAEALLRPLRGAIDHAVLKSALRPAALLQPAVAVRGMREAVKLDKVHDLVRMAGDLGRVQSRAGTRAALDGLRIAEAPKDVERLARLAAAQGGKTRAVLKLLGRGAIVLTMGLLHLASWILWAVLTAFGFCSALKRLAERWTQRAIDRRKRRRAARAAAAVAA